MRIMIDPGHGGKDPGAVGNGLQEKNLVLTIGLHIKNILLNEYEGVQVRMTRETDIFHELSARAKMANDWGANFFLSVHINAGNGTGFESYVHQSRSQASIAAQNDIHAEIMKSIPGITDRGKKVANFAVLRETRMPSLLTEVLFIDRTADAAKLKDAAFLQQVARGHAEGIAKAFGLKKKEGSTVSNEPSTWAQEAWEWAVRNNLIDGARPKDSLTREELVTILFRFERMRRMTL